MKSFHKSLVILCAILMILGCTMPVFATGTLKTVTGPGKITVTNNDVTKATLDGRSFTAYRLFQATYKKKDGAAATAEPGAATYSLTDEQAKVILAAKDDLNALGMDLDGSEDNAQLLKKVITWLKPMDKDRSADELLKFSRAILKANKAPNDKLPKEPLNVETKDPEGHVTALSTKAAGIELGYYMVVDTTANNKPEDQMAANIALTNAAPEREFQVKADAPELTKKIDNAAKNDPTNDATTLTSDNHSVGETVKYTLTSKVPQNMDGFDNYVFIMHDALSKGLTFDKKTANISVKINGEPLTETSDVNDAANTKKYFLDVKPITDTSEGDEYKDGTRLDFVFLNFLQYNTKDLKGKTIEITYEVKVNKDAENGRVGNPNKANLWFQRTPDEFSKGTNRPDDKDIHGKTPDSIVRSYTTDLILKKVDEVGNTLVGAKFQLKGTRSKMAVIKGQVFKTTPPTDTKDITYKPNEDTADYYQLKDGSYTTDKPTVATKDKYKEGMTTPANKLYDYVEVQTGTKDGQDYCVEQITGQDGLIHFEGLGAGTYVLTELEAPQGYSKVSPMTIKIEWTKPTDPASATDPDYKCTWTYYLNGEKKVDSDLPDGQANTFVVEDKSDIVLPQTGGIGTTIFYMVGGLLALVAVVVLVSRKRMLSSQR